MTDALPGHHPAGDARGLSVHCVVSHAVRDSRFGYFVDKAIVLSAATARLYAAHDSEGSAFG
jgi:hypothetical protein